MNEDKIQILCPCCQSKLTVDSKTGSVLWHEVKKTGKKSPSMVEMIEKLESQKKEVHEKVSNESKALKERSRILEEKFKEAMKHLDTDDDIRPIRPIDLD